MRKKAQVQTQILVYVMVLIVGAGILIYGYKAITGFRGQADDALYQSFKLELEKDLKSITFQSMKVVTYEMPSSAKQVCFKTPYAGPADVVFEEQRQVALEKQYTYTLIKTAVTQKTNDNVFMYPEQSDSFYIGVKIALGNRIGSDGKELFGTPDNFKCFDVTGSMLKIKITGKEGGTVLIEE